MRQPSIWLEFCFGLGQPLGRPIELGSYSLSPEYFTRFKFDQFRYLDFGFPNRAFVALIGFQAGLPAGALIGWLLARFTLNRSDRSSAHRDVIRGFASVFGCLLSGSILGSFYGYLRADSYPEGHMLGWETELPAGALRRFIVVACIHNAGYISGVLGLLLARYAVVRRGAESGSNFSSSSRKRAR